MEHDVDNLKQKLVQVNNNITEQISLSPLQEYGTELTIEQLFATVVIRKVPMGYNSENCLKSFQTDSDSNSGSFHGGTKSKLYRSFSQIYRNFVNPFDIFQLDNGKSNNIYIKGDAAHGKTTFCVWVLKKWCDVYKKNRKERELDIWETALKEFDFVFMLQFRNVNPNGACVIDMVCQNITKEMKDCRSTIQHILKSEKYRSLIVMDGLDEWNPNEEARNKLSFQGIPNIEELSSMVTCLISMRPWIFSSISKLLKRNDSVIEILGLSETGIKNVIENVLKNRYNLKENSEKYNAVYNRIKMNLKQTALKSFMQIPLLAVVCVQIWYEKKKVEDSMTSFFAVMLDMLIERAHHKHKLRRKHVDFQEEKEDRHLPDLLSEYTNIEKCHSILLKLGKIAFEGLISNKTVFVFQERKLENEIGVNELQFVLDVGLISQNEAPSLTTKNVSVNFFHKYIQEFLSAIYVVTNTEVRDSFCEHLSSVMVIMEFSNVIMFICGMCPSLGSVISQRVASVTDNDTDISTYRKSDAILNSTLRELYRLQVRWYSELRCRQSKSPVTFHISDVYLDKDSDIETIRGTKALLSDQKVESRSLMFLDVPTDEECGITMKELDAFLCISHNNTKSLVKVYINSIRTKRSVHHICIPSLRHLYLYNLNINSPYLGDNRPLLKDLTSLRELRLYDVNLGGRVLGLSDMTSLCKLKLKRVSLGSLGSRGLALSGNMVHIENVWLESVQMSALQWQLFIQSVLSIQHKFQIILCNTDIDKESKTEIRSSRDLEVKQDCLDTYTDRYDFVFTRVIKGLSARF